MIQHDFCVDRYNSIESRLVAIEAKLRGQCRSAQLNRVRRVLNEKDIRAYNLVRVPADYYSWNLARRALQLQCPSVQHLCKTIVMENTACTADDCSDKTNSRYYCVILQYCRKLNTDKLRDLVHQQRSAENRLPRKRFHFRLAPADVNDALTGFEHNAVSPFGMLTDIPIIICQHALEVSPSYLFLGGGEVDVKLGISVHDLVRAANPIVGHITDPRDSSAAADDLDDDA